MGDVVVLRPGKTRAQRTARELTWKSLTRIERVYVRVVESDRRLFELFDALQRDYYETKKFLVPIGLFQFEETALHTMHRFVDELADHMERLKEADLPSRSSLNEGENRALLLHSLEPEER